MQVPNLLSARFWITNSLGVIFLVVLALVLFDPRTRTDDPGPQAKPPAKVAPGKVEPEPKRSRHAAAAYTLVPRLGRGRRQADRPRPRRDR